MTTTDVHEALAGPAAPAIRRMVADDVPAVAGILAWSFSGKTAAAAPDRPEVAARLFAEVALAGNDAWVAEDGGVVGVVTFQDRRRPWYAHAEWPLVRTMRPLRRRFRAMLFLLLFHAADFPASELYLETMAVHPAARGRGVGGALLGFAEREARRRGRATLSLYCIRDNPRARALYVRHGYRLVHSEDLWWCSGLLGFRITDLLRRRVPAEPA